jgi:hypothetical protein
MKDLGELHYCLGLEVWRNAGQTFVCQSKYIREILKRFKMDQCKSSIVSMQQNVKLSCDDGSKEVNGTVYRQMVIQIMIGLEIWVIEDQPLDMRSTLDPGLFHGAVKSSLLYLCLPLKQNIKPCVQQLVKLFG